jgi:hypothetical protein
MAEANLVSMVNTQAQVEEAVRCSIVLSGGNDFSRLSVYLLLLNKAKLPENYEVLLINDSRLDLDQRQLRASLPALKVLDTDAPLGQEQLFDRGAMATSGKYLLFVRNLITFEKWLLEEAINNLETSGEKVSLSAHGKFILVERFHYANVGGFGGLFGNESLAAEQVNMRKNRAVVPGFEATDRSAIRHGAVASSEVTCNHGTTYPVAPQVRSLSKEELADKEWEHKYSLLRQPKIRGAVPGGSEVHDQIELELRGNNFNVREMEIDVVDYWEYVKAAKIYNMKRYYGGHAGPTFPEKSLEHYLAAKLLELGPNDVYIDMASATSPVPEVYSRLFGCKTYRQDLSYPPGINGDRIGGDAGAIPVPDGFATKMGLHCSFEHFEQDSDTRFIIEAGRVLQPGGKVSILPLYFFSRYAIQTDPAVFPEGGMEFEPDAVLYCKKGYRNRHGRFYDVSHFINRFRNALNRLDLIIYLVKNARNVHSSCYVRFIAILEKKQNTVN